MCELDAATDLEHPRVGSRPGTSHVEAESCGGPSEYHGVANRLRGGCQDEQLCVRREYEQALGIALFDLAGQRPADGHPESAGEICDVAGARQLEERQRVAMTLRDDLVADRAVERAVHAVQEQRACIVVVEPLDS
jgi:hypothetical protein